MTAVQTVWSRAIGEWRIPAKFASDVAGRLLLLGLFVVAARLLAPADLGAYAFALAIGLMLGPLADSGLPMSLLHRLSGESDPRVAGRALAESLRARLVAGLALGLIGAAVAATAGRDPPSAVACSVIAFSLVMAGHGELWLHVARAFGRLDLEAAVGFAARLLLVAVGGLGLLVGGGLPALAVGHAVGAATTILLARRAGRRFLEPHQAGPWRHVWQAYTYALPIGVAGIASMIMFRVDVVLLQLLRGPETVALYSAAYRPFEASLLLPIAVMAAVFPRLVRAAAARRAERRPLGTLVARVGAFLLAAALAVAVAGWLVGPIVIPLAFGTVYVPAGDVLRLLVLALPAIYLNALLTQTLIALGRPWWLALSMIAGLVANGMLNLLLIPQLGAHGAALATVFAEGVLLVSVVYAIAASRRALRRHTEQPVR